MKKPQPKHKKIIDIYRDVLRNARYFKEEAKHTIGNKARKEKLEDIAYELYRIAANLEKIEEINPTKGE